MIHCEQDLLRLQQFLRVVVTMQKQECKETKKMDKSYFVATPGSFISDCFFYDELSRVCGAESAQYWLTSQLNARSFCTTATPGTPQTASAPTSPRLKVGVIDRLGDSHFMPNLQAFSENSKSFSLGSQSSRDWGDSGVKADGSSNFGSRFHSFSHSRKTETARPNKNWKQWKSYADGHPKAPMSRLSFHASNSPLPEHQEQSESASSDSSENVEGSERLESAAAPCVSCTGAAASRAPANDLDGTEAGLMRLSIDSGRPLSMRSLAQLVSERDEHDRLDGHAANMGLLFTDAAHTVLER